MTDAEQIKAALELAAQKMLRIDFTDEACRVEYGLHTAGKCGSCSETLGADPASATRRAIARALAAIAD
jgi:hypothetical protein